MSSEYDVDRAITDLEYEQEQEQAEYSLNDLAHYAKIAYATNKWVNAEGKMVDLMEIDLGYFLRILKFFANNRLLDNKRIKHLVARRSEWIESK